MATLKFIFSLFVSFCIVKGGLSQCTLSDISVAQTAVGEFQGATEYQVSISNGCICSQGRLVFQCAGFNSFEPVDPTLFKPTGGDQCLANNGQPIHDGETVSFKYASKSQVALSPLSSEIACS
ncbi:TPD1 protein homolog 1-like [Curcuma longa]|uniref:TPD1 protein homolog 1-like n=1 Tax=Curcuma longa TaxID=136217 RepID=UPI003D9E49AD